MAGLNNLKLLTDFFNKIGQSQHMQRTPKSIDVRFAPKATVSAKMRSAALSHKPTSIFVGAR